MNTDTLTVGCVGPEKPNITIHTNASHSRPENPITNYKVARHLICQTCRKEWNVSRLQKIPPNGYECPSCERKRRLNNLHTPRKFGHKKRAHRTGIRKAQR